MSLFEINKKTCTKCGECADVCPAKIIELINEGHPSVAKNGEFYCIKCGHCVAVCPNASLNHQKIKADDCVQIKNELKISEEQCIQFLRSRRSIRVFKDKAIPRDEIAKIIDTARFAPTARNMQPVKWLVVADRDEIKKLSGLTADWMKYLMTNEPKNPLSKVYVGVVEKWEEGIDVIFRSAPALIVAHAREDDRTSGPIALTFLDLAASAMGLGCCWAGYFYRAAVNYDPMKLALRLPDSNVCIGAMMIGYPKYEYHRIPARKKADIMWRM